MGFRHFVFMRISKFTKILFIQVSKSRPFPEF